MILTILAHVVLFLALELVLAILIIACLAGEPDATPGTFVAIFSIMNVLVGIIAAVVWAVTHITP